MKIQDFVKAYQENLEGAGIKLNQDDVRTLVDVLADTVIIAVQAGEEVSIPQFGKFSKKEQKGRAIRNPQTGEAVLNEDGTPKISETKSVPKFKPAGKFEEAVK